MFNQIYIEDDVRDHPRTRAIIRRFPHIPTVSCTRFGEIFNRKAQSFRLQKRKPALILARKHGRLVLPCPAGYGIGAQRDFYFSHMLNCLYDCRYCYLQGMYRSAHYVLFVNYEDFFRQIENLIRQHGSESLCFFSGYDCDSLVFDPVTRFTPALLDFLRTESSALVELRTKSTQIRSLLKTRPVKNCVVAFSFTPEAVSRQIELQVPPLKRRLDAIRKLQQTGWLIGLRFDPVIYTSDYAEQYQRLFTEVFATVDTEILHSVSVGGFRLPKNFFQEMIRQYPDERLFAAPLNISPEGVSYHTELQAEMMECCRSLLSQYISDDIFFLCASS